MDLTYTTIIVLASMMFVLTAMMGYLYWQHMRLHQGLQSLALVVSSIVNPPHHLPEPEPEPEPEREPEAETEQVVNVPSVPAPAPAPAPAPETKAEEDDRASVSASSVDVDDLQSKTVSQLRELLDKKGLPYGKRDSKTTLIELLKASS